MSRQSYQLSPDDIETLRGYAVFPVMVIAGREPADMIQSTWESIAERMEFDVDSVEDLDAKTGAFTAEPTLKGQQS